MAPWQHVLDSAPDLARTAQARFDATGLGFLATLRADGFPRISGIEPLFDEEVWLGMMPGSRKAHDLQRDPRFALHNASVDKEVKEGDARLTGLAVEVLDEATIDATRQAFADHAGYPPPPGPMHLFRLDVREVMVLRAAGDHLDIAWWSASGGLRQVERR